MTSCNALARALGEVIGPDRVIVDRERLEYYSTDFSEQVLGRAAIVVRPTTTDEVSALMRVVHGAGYAAVARGGGMSYTLTYSPSRPDTVIFDMTDMNRILEIDEENLTVTVEPGVTWASLREAFRGRPYAIPYQGTMSGVQATIGGGLGNNATGLGPGDISTDLLGLEVVLADGRVIQTGALANSPGGPVIRNYGPDFTGLFIHDAGTFGIKTRATFRIARKPGGTAFVTLGFTEVPALVRALVEIARSGAASNLYSFSTYHHQLFASEPPPSATAMKELMRDVIEASSSWVRALRDLALAYRPGGLKFLLNWDHSLHIICRGFDQGTADRMAREVRTIARRHGATRLPSTLFLAMNAQPFHPIDRLIVGKDGECSFPSNCCVPLSEGPRLSAAVETFLSENALLMERHGIRATRLYLSTAANFGCEPIFYWFDRMNPLRYSVLGPDRQATVGRTPENSEVRAAALDLRRRLVADVFAPFGGAHFQIGKYYPYRAGIRNPEVWRLLTDFKALVDPMDTMNPGALGLEVRTPALATENGLSV